MPSPYTSHLQGIAILVVEDDFFTAEAMRCALEDAGSEVIGPACDDASARRLMESRRPDLALLDVHLGSETCTALARELWLRDVPILLVTGYSAAELLPVDLRDLPRVVKPVAPQALRRAIGLVLADGCLSELGVEGRPARSRRSA